MPQKTLTKGSLTLILDTDFLEYRKNQMLSLLDSDDFEELTNKKNKKLTKSDYEKAVNRLVKLAEDIIENKLGIDIFEYLPVTKAGKFHKTGTIFLATSEIKDVFNGDYFQMNVMDLRISPVSYADKINPFVAITKTGDLFGTVTGDGDVGYIELDWYPHQKKENPIFDEENNPTKQVKTRNKYLKDEALKPGYAYLDAKGNKFLYLGHFINYSFENLSLDTKEKFLKSQEYKDFKKWYDEDEWHTGKYFFAKITKKIEKEMSEAKNIDEFLKHRVEKDFWYWYKGLKTLEHPLKVVSEVGKVIDDTFDNGYYYSELDYDGELLKEYFYFEKY